MPADQSGDTSTPAERIPDLDDLEADTVEAIEAVLEGVSTGEASEFVDLLPSQEQEDILKLAMAQVCVAKFKRQKTFFLLSVSMPCVATISLLKMRNFFG